MKLFEIEIGRSYKCDRKGGQYVATVKEKQDGRIGVALHNVAESVSDPRGLIWLKTGEYSPAVDCRSYFAFFLPLPRVPLPAVMAKDSSDLPDFRAAVSQRGFSPRPAQVAPLSGSRYLGATAPRGPPLAFLPA